MKIFTKNQWIGDQGARVDELSFSSIDMEDKKFQEREFQKSKLAHALKKYEVGWSPWFGCLQNSVLPTMLEGGGMVTLGFFKEFQDTCKFGISLNSSFIALIPKRNNTKNTDFRPIILVGSVCKHLAMVLPMGWRQCWGI